MIIIQSVIKPVKVPVTRVLQIMSPINCSFHDIPTMWCMWHTYTHITEMTHFCWWNVFDNVCGMCRWSFWCWFDALFTKTCTKKRFLLHFRSQWPSPFTFRPQICSPSYSCPRLWFYQIGNFYGSVISSKSMARDRRTDRRTDRQRGPHSLTITSRGVTNKQSILEWASWCLS